MAGATERKPLVCSQRGDIISIGWKVSENWKAKDREPIAGWIDAAGRGKDFKVRRAFEIVGKMGHDYLTLEPKSCPHASHEGFISLECMEGGIGAVRLLQPIYDLCAVLPAPHIWYDQASLRAYERGKFCVEEPRAAFRRDMIQTVLGRWDMDSAGTYYPSYAKILRVIEMITTPFAQDDITAMLNMRRMVEEDAYLHGFKRMGRTDQDANWKLAQERMAARAVWYMGNSPWAGIGKEAWLDISWPLEAPSRHPSIDRLGRLNENDARHLFIPLLRLLKDDQSIHLVDEAIPEWSYSGGMMGPRRPDSQEPPRAKSA